MFLRHHSIESWHRARVGLLAAAAIGLLSTANASASGPTPVQGRGWWCEAYRCGQVELIDVDLVSAANGWMIEVSEGVGTLAHWDGRLWQPAQTPATGGLRTVDLSSATEGWAMGSGDVALHWGNAGWTSVAVPSGVIRDVVSLTPADAWAVGSTCILLDGNCPGTILHWNGQAWSAVASPTQIPLLSIDMVSSSDGWAVGGYCPPVPMYAGSCAHVLLRWNGSQWTVWREAIEDGVSPYTDVSLADSRTGWIVDGLELLKWNGSDWQLDPEGWSSISDVDAVSAHEAWAVSNSDVLRWDGQSWSQVATAKSQSWIAIDVNDGGVGAVVGSKGAAMGWNGASWSPTTPFLEAWGLGDAVEVVSPTEAWAARSYSGILHWDGSRWTPFDLPPSANGIVLYDIDFAAADEGWAVGGDGLALHWNGQQWQQVAVPNDGHLGHVQSISPSSAWALTWKADSLAMLHWDGQSWAFTDPTGINLPPTAFAMRTDTDGWLAIYDDLFHWNGSSWAPVPDPSDAWILGIDSLAEDDAWAVGEMGTLMHWNGVDWTLAPSPTQAALHAVALSAPDDGWALGYNGILHWDGVNWIVVEPGERPRGGLFLDIDVAGDTGFIIGDAMLRLDALRTQFLPSLLRASR